MADTDDNPNPNPESTPSLSGGPEPTPQPEPTSTPQPQPGAPPTDWRDRQIMRKNDRIADLERQLQDAQSRLNSARSDPAATQPHLDEAEFDRRVNTKAREEAVRLTFLERCNEAQNQGKQLFQDFDEKVGSLLKLVDRNDPVSSGAYSALIAAALETGEAPRLVHALGSDLNEAARLLSMNPTRMAVELTKKAAALVNNSRRSPDSDTLQQTNAPPPIRPVGGRGVSHTSIDPTDPDRADNLSTAEWMRRRDMQLSARDRGEAA